MTDEREPTQQTQLKKGKPMTIPIPTRGEFDRLVKCLYIKILAPRGGVR